MLHTNPTAFELDRAADAAKLIAPRHARETDLGSEFPGLEEEYFDGDTVWTNGFLKGLVIATPLALAMWAAIFWVLL